MGDQNDTASEFVPKLTQQIEYLGLDGDIERGRRLVRDDERWAASDGDRRHDALPQPSGEFVGEHPEAQRGIRYADGRHEPDRFVGVARDLRDLFADPHRRVERRHRVLEDDAQVVAAHRAELVRRSVHDVGAGDADGPIHDRPRGSREQPHHG